MTIDYGTYANAEALASLPDMDVATLSRLVGQYRPDEIFCLPPSEILRMGLSQAARRTLTTGKAGHLARASEEEKFVGQKGIDTLFFGTSGFPERMAKVPAAPVRVFAIGNGKTDQSLTVGIVGTRHATPYGCQITRDIVADLAKIYPEVNIISGLAYGIDVAAHRAALDNHVCTTAVMATPMHTVYPAAHRDIAARIVRSGGLMLSEMPSWGVTGKASFLRRNRIIAALSDVVIVVESDIHGGALVTARYAREFGRYVFAVPGRITDRYSAGTNALISNGHARIFTTVTDMLAAMGIKYQPTADMPVQQTFAFEPTEEQANILKTLEANPDASTNMLASTLSIPYHVLTATLMEMEECGLIEPLPGARYRLLKQ